MKISEIEEKLVYKYSDGLMEDFKTALKRVPKDRRCQHCYTTAVAFKPKHADKAIDLMEYGLEFCDGWLDEMRTYMNMATVYESVDDYKNALEFYEKALLAIDDDIREDYAADLSFDMMRMEMHLNSFEYTKKLEELYRISMDADGFSRSFLHFEFYRLVAETIIYTRNEDFSSAKEVAERAKSMLGPVYLGPLKQLLKKHCYEDSPKATKEATAFLKRTLRSL